VNTSLLTVLSEQQNTKIACNTNKEQVSILSVWKKSNNREVSFRRVAQESTVFQDEIAICRVYVRLSDDAVRLIFSVGIEASTARSQQFF
jgi:hypothetical protein